MAKDNCPGSRPKPLTTENYNCPNCGHEIEIFSDEFKTKCPKCKKEVLIKNI